MIAFIATYNAVDDYGTREDEKVLSGFGLTPADALARTVAPFDAPEELSLHKIDLASGAIIATLPLAPYLNLNDYPTPPLHKAAQTAYTEVYRRADAHARARAKINPAYFAANKAFEDADKAREDARQKLTTMRLLTDGDTAEYTAARDACEVARRAYLAARDYDRKVYQDAYDADLAANPELAAAKIDYTAALLDIFAAAFATLESDSSIVAI